MLIEVYECESKRTKLTLTPDRVTIKVSYKQSQFLEHFRALAINLVDSIQVDFSHRGQIFIDENGVYITGSICAGRNKKRVIRFLYTVPLDFISFENVIESET